MLASKKRGGIAEMSVKPITGRQIGELCRLLEERDISGEEFQFLNEHPDNVVNLIRGHEVLKMPDAPTDLRAILESQANQLIEKQAYEQVSTAKSKYKDELMNEVGNFVWRPELAAIGLDWVDLVDYRLLGQFLVEASGVVTYINPDKCHSYKDVVTPGGVMVIQAQWGPKYRNKKPFWCRDHFHALEQGTVVKEGLTAFLYRGENLLKECFIDLAGSVSENDHVPCLYWRADRPELCDRWYDPALPYYGSASRGKCLG